MSDVSDGGFLTEEQMRRLCRHLDVPVGALSILHAVETSVDNIKFLGDFLATFQDVTSEHLALAWPGNEPEWDPPSYWESNEPEYATVNLANLRRTLPADSPQECEWLSSEERIVAAYIRDEAGVSSLRELHFPEPSVEISVSELPYEPWVERLQKARDAFLQLVRRGRHPRDVETFLGELRAVRAKLGSSRRAVTLRSLARELHMTERTVSHYLKAADLTMSKVKSGKF